MNYNTKLLKNKMRFLVYKQICKAKKDSENKIKNKKENR
jgi:hypothetical protein